MTNPYSDQIDNKELDIQNIIIFDFNLVDKHADFLNLVSRVISESVPAYFIVDELLSVTEAQKILKDLKIEAGAIHTSNKIDSDRIMIAVGETEEFLKTYKSMGVKTYLVNWEK